MRTRLKSFLFLTFLGISSISFGQSAELLSENIGSEADVRNVSPYFIEIELTQDSFFTTDIVKTAILDGLKGSSTEFDAVIEAAKGDLDNNVVFLENDSIVRIRIEQFSSYYINEDDKIGITIPASALRISSSELDLADSILITNLATTVTFGGDLTGSTLETEIRENRNVLSLTLTNNLWVSNVASSGALPTVKSMFSAPSTEFIDMVSSLTADSISVSADLKTLTIAFLAKSDYYIAVDEDVDLLAAQSLLQVDEPYADATHSFTISDVDPTITISDQSFSESDVQDGNSFDVTLLGDIWVNPVDPGDIFKDNVVGDNSEWDLEIQSTIVVTWQSNSVVRVSWLANSDYKIDLEEKVSITSVDAVHLANTLSAITVLGEQTITPNPATLVADLTANNVSEGDIRNGVHYITLTLAEDTWVTGTGDGGSIDDNLLASIECSPSSIDWENLIESADVFPPVAGVVTIEIPDEIDFDIIQDISLSVTPPPATFVGGSTIEHLNFDVIERIAPYIVLTTSPATLLESHIDNGDGYLIATLYEDTFNDTRDKDNFTLETDPDLENTNDEISIHDNQTGDLTLNSPTEMQILLNVGSHFNISVDNHLSLDIDENELSGNDDVSSTDFVTIHHSIEPIIENVTIDDVPMGIGTAVRAIITVEEATQVFTYHAGTIAGRVPVVSKENDFTYYADFTIDEDSDPEYSAIDTILVEGLQLYNSTVPGEIYDSIIIGTNDLIDSRKPAVDLIHISDGNYKVDDQIIATIQAFEAGLTFDEDATTINTIKLSAGNVDFKDVGSGIYQLIYDVEDGNPDVDPGPIPVSVVMRDSVNTSDLFNTVSGVTTIDAHKPGIISATVTSSGVQTPDSVVNITIVSTETGLFLGAGSHVNQVMSPAQIDLRYDSVFIYTLTYIVGPGDDAMDTPNGLKSTIILVDDNGNEVSLINGLEFNDVTIVTEAPSANIYGGGGICPGDSVEIFVNLVGDGPFSLLISDGTTDAIHTNKEASYSFKVSQESADTYDYTISEVKDVYGVVGTGSGTAQVTRHIAAEATIINDKTTFQVTAEGVDLIPSSPRPGVGTFSGLGVVSADTSFYPSIRGITDSTLVFYDYEETATGCSTVDTIEFSVVNAQAKLTIPDFVCYDSNDSIITGENFSGTPGFLRMTEIVGKVEEDRSEFLDSIAPDGNTARARIMADNNLRGGTYKIYFYYLYDQDTKYSSISKTFVLDFIQEVKFIKPADHDILTSGLYSVCNDTVAMKLETNLDRSGETFEYSNTGGGVYYDGALSQYMFDPKEAPIDKFRINYVYTSQESGCHRRADFFVTNKKVPTVDFTPQSHCIPTDGGPIGFINTTTDEDLIVKWRWDFGDVNSGESNIDTSDIKTNPIHEYTAPGTRTVELEIKTERCVASYDTIIDFADKPIADFRWVSDCYLDDVGVEFVNESFSEWTWNSFIWRIKEEDGTPIDSDTTTTKENIEFIFNQLSNYEITLISENELECSDTLTRLLKLKETVTLEDADYFESFNQSDGRWSIDQDSLSSRNSWVYSEPDFHGFSPSSEDYAWFTQLTSVDDRIEGEDYDERSWMQSPCFDFRETDRPMIRMDVMKSFDDNRDGAVLQYTLNNGIDWTTIGSTGEGISWYNSFDIIEAPGGGNGSSIGWSGDNDDVADTAWITAAHDLDELKGEETVIFGIFYATDGASITGNQGFAFDDVYIGERTKRGLIEHFTNSASIGAVVADSKIDAFSAANELDVTNLQYHMHFPDVDPMNENNSSPGSSRSFYYGVSTLPYAIMDGGSSYDFNPSIPTRNELKKLTLEDPMFELDIIYQLDADRLITKIDMKALQDLDSMEVILNVSIVEKSVSGYTGLNGDTEFKNVVLTMLPSAAGLLYSKAWDKFESVDEQYSWTYNGVEDVSDLMVVAFVQNRDTDKVLQVATEDVPETGLSAVSHQLKSMKLYPNPAQNELHVEFAEPVVSDGFIEISDMTGRVVMVTDIYKQDQIVYMDIGLLREGSYILQTKENGNLTRRMNFIKVR